jgi:hypothetical protein
MSEVITFRDYRPPARYDDLPWTAARIQQSATEGGSYTLTEEIELDPLDDDPEHPAARTLTSELGTADLWYRIVWVDESGDTSEPTVPVENVSGTMPEGITAFATVDELARIVLQTSVTPTATQTAQMERVLAAAAGEIVAECGRNDFAGWELALVAEVSIERAAEHWTQMKAPFGIIGIGAELGGAHTATDSWNRHANKLAPLKRVWGLA